MSRYFEIIITGRQLAALVAGVALLVAVAFGLGLGVRALRPAPNAAREVVATAPAVVAVPQLAVAPAATATPAPPPTPPPTAAPTPPAVSTERPRPQATSAPAAAAATRGASRWVQVAAFGKKDQAEGVRNRVVALGYTLKQVVVQPAAGGKFRVRVGPFPDGESAGRVTARLRAEGFGGAFVVKPGE